MKVKKLTVSDLAFPPVLKEAKPVPEALFVMGAELGELLQKPRITIIGSRKASLYGKGVTEQLAGELARAGVVIISGLALGIDSIGHRAALEASTPTIAVMPCGLERIYPASHYHLAQDILRQGGALVSEYDEGTRIYQSNFIARNRIAAALGDGVLIIEAAERSGTLSTARFALEQGKDVMVVPGNITSPTSAGTNNLIKAGALPVTCAADIFHILGIAPALSNHPASSSNPEEQAILTLLRSGISDGAELHEKSGLNMSRFNQNLTMLEIQGFIRPLGNNQWISA